MSEREISGRKRFFQFGTYTFKIIRQQTGVQFIEDVFSNLANKKRIGHENGEDIYGPPIMSQIDHIDYLTQFLFSCAKHAALSLKESIDFNDVDVSDWMDQIGYESAMALVTELIESYAESEKNHKAPAMGQHA